MLFSSSSPAGFSFLEKSGRRNIAILGKNNGINVAYISKNGTNAPTAAIANSINILRDCEALIEAMAPWKDLDYPLNYQGSERTKAFIGTMPTATLLVMILTQVILKVAYEIIILPLTIIVTEKTQKYENNLN